MDEQEKAFEKFYREKAAKDLGRVESEIQALDPFYRRQLELQEDQLLRDRLKRDNIPIQKEEREFEVKKKKNKSKKTLANKYNNKKGKAYAQSPRPVNITA